MQHKSYASLLKNGNAKAKAKRRTADKVEVISDHNSRARAQTKSTKSHMHAKHTLPDVVTKISLLHIFVGHILDWPG